MSAVTPAPKPTRRLAWIAAAAIVVLAVIAIMGSYLAQPQRATRLILDRLGNTLGLEITATGGEYRLSPMPSLVVHDVSAREPGAGARLLRARRISLSLPWSTIRSRGSDLTIQRIELDRPVVDLAALQHWLLQRPPGKTRVPTLTNGLDVRDGTLLGDGWRVGELALHLPTLAPAQRVATQVSGRYRSSGLQVPFSLDVVLSEPAPDAALGIAGDVAIERPDWRMPAYVVLSALTRPAGGLHLQRAKLSASARYESGATHAPFALGVAGMLRLADGVRLVPAAIAVRATGLVPTLDAAGTLELGDTLQVGLDGALGAWPAAWPGLPAPLDHSTSPLPFRLRYAGEPDLSDIARLDLRRDAARFEGRFRLADVAAWIDATKASPLPPVTGRFEAPELEITGAHLEGVEVTLDGGDDADAKPEVVH